MSDNNMQNYEEQMEEIPVFVFTGFLESGKTTLVHEWLNEEYFQQGQKTVVLVCEEGEAEYDEEAFEKKNITIIHVDAPDEFTEEFLAEINEKYQPVNVVIEHNCMTKMDDTFSVSFPAGWYIEDVITAIDASSFTVQMKNMAAIMSEQFRYSSLVIFNRCEDDTNKVNLRASIKALNPPATVLFMGKDGKVEKADDVLPFDFNADVIEISDIDYGLWYIDVMENIERYDGKTVKFKGMAVKPENFPPTAFIAGRQAMTCCSDDLAFLRVLCTSKDKINVKDESWINITAKVGYKNDPEQGPLPVLEIIKLENAEKPETELVYFS